MVWPGSKRRHTIGNDLGHRGDQFDVPDGGSGVRRHAGASRQTGVRQRHVGQHVLRLPGHESDVGLGAAEPRRLLRGHAEHGPVQLHLVSEADAGASTAAFSIPSALSKRRSVSTLGLMPSPRRSSPATGSTRPASAPSSARATARAANRTGATPSPSSSRWPSFGSVTVVPPRRFRRFEAVETCAAHPRR